MISAVNDREISVVASWSFLAIDKVISLLATKEQKLIWKYEEAYLYHLPEN